MSGIDEVKSTSRDRRPTVRSRVFDNQELDLSTKLPALYKSDQIVYIKGPRRVDPAIHKIYKALGDGQYQLSRHGQIVLNQAGTGPRIFEEGELQAKAPPPLFQPGQPVYETGGGRGIDPIEYKIHKVLDDGKYQLSQDGEVVFEKDKKTPKEFSENGLRKHQ